MDSYNIGLRVKKLRKKLNLKQKEFAEMVGMSSGSLSEVESGKRFPPFEAFVSICGILFENGSSANWLLTGEEKAKSTEKQSTAQESELTETEEMILESYRHADKRKKRLILQKVLEISNEETAEEIIPLNKAN